MIKKELQINYKKGKKPNLIANEEALTGNHKGLAAIN